MPSCSPIRYATDRTLAGPHAHERAAGRAAGIVPGNRRRILETQQGTEAQPTAIEADYPAAARLFSSVDRKISLSFIREYALGGEAMQRFTARHYHTAG